MSKKISLHDALASFYATAPRHEMETEMNHIDAKTVLRFFQENPERWPDFWKCYELDSSNSSNTTLTPLEILNRASDKLHFIKCSGLESEFFIWYKLHSKKLTEILEYEKKKFITALPDLLAEIKQQKNIQKGTVTTSAIQNFLKRKKNYDSMLSLKWAQKQCEKKKYQHTPPCQEILRHVQNPYFEYLE